MTRPASNQSNERNMLAGLVEKWIEAYRAPRQSARRMLSIGPSRIDALLMALVGYALPAAATKGMEIAFNRPLDEAMRDLLGVEQTEAAAAAAAAVDPLTIIVSGLATALALFVITAGLAYSIGSRVGGKGDIGAMFTIMGWHSLAGAPALILATAMILGAPAGNGGFAMLVWLGIYFYLFYMLGAFIAEAHAFPNVARVMFAMVGVAFGFGLLASMLFAAFAA